MNRVATWGLSLAVLMMASATRAEALRSGPQPGETLDSYQVTKVAGAPDDGVPVGQQLCYRCKMGNRPVVMVFSRKPDRALARLVKRLDAVVAQNKDEHNMASFVSLLGDKPDELAKSSKEIVNDTKVENVAFVVPAEQPNGPEAYKINPQVETTVLIYVKGTVVANRAIAPGELSDEMDEKIVADTAKILK
ncbi:MAG TPA: hypothetical protein VFE46_15975 [Pirellulales bacterium]|jgi:hypothetical protein|nr:hypothetical protein [Pirellulales bacterium]